MDLSARLAAHAAAGLTRKHRVVEGPQSVRLRIEGGDFINFSSNDYLGLANHPEVVGSFREAAARYGAGTGAAHLVTGHQEPHQQLEKDLAAFTGYERALLFSTGYMANLAVLTTLADRGDVIYQDRLNHASLNQGGQASRARVRRYAHADTGALRRMINDDGRCSGLIATDGVFSMEGDVAPLEQLAEIATSNGLLLYVDDAHGIGVFGKGRGTVAESGLDSARVPVLMGTLGKALGTFGAFVAASDEIIESLVQFAGSYVYTTAPPAAIAEATRTSLRLLQTEPGRSARLHDHIQWFRKLAGDAGIRIHDTHSAIQVIPQPDVATLMAARQSLEDRGLLVGAIRPPTASTPRLRITLCSEHSPDDITRLVEALQELGSA